LKNIDVFNVAALEILHQRVNSFPVNLELDSGKIAIAVTKYFEEPKKISELFAHFCNLDEICLHTIRWLRDEEFIRVIEDSNNDSYLVVISQKGLQAINKSPSITGDKKSFKEIFNNGLSSLPFSVASGLMTEFFK
jgi:hypothetical protein